MKKRPNKILVRDIVENSKMIYEKLNNISNESKNLQEQNSNEIHILENNTLKEDIDSKINSLISNSIKEKINEFLPSIVDSVAKEISDYIEKSINDNLLNPLKENCNNIKNSINTISELSDTLDEEENEEEEVAVNNKDKNVEEKVEEKKEEEGEEHEEHIKNDELQEEETKNHTFDDNGDLNGETAIEYDADDFWISYAEEKHEIENTITENKVEDKKQEVETIQENNEEKEIKDEEEKTITNKRWVMYQKEDWEVVVEEVDDIEEPKDLLSSDDIILNDIENDIEDTDSKNNEELEQPKKEDNSEEIEIEMDTEISNEQEDEIMDDFFNSDVTLEKKWLSMEEEEEAINRMNRDLEDQQDNKVYSDVEVPYVVEEGDDYYEEINNESSIIDTSDIGLGDTSIQQDIEIDDESVQTNIKIKKKATLDTESINTMPSNWEVVMGNVENVLQPEIKIDSVSLNSDIHASGNIVWGGLQDEMELVEEAVVEEKDDENEVEEEKKKKQDKKKIVNTWQNLETLTNQAISWGSDKEINLDDEIDAELANMEMETLQWTQS